MTALAIALAILSQLFMAAGQLLLKHAMTKSQQATPMQTAVRLAPGVIMLTLWFFIWLGLLARWDLSLVFPFSGLGPALLVIAARIWLHEKLTPLSWAGVFLIAGGVGLVSWTG